MNNSRNTGAILILCMISMAIVTLQAVAQQHKNDEPNMVLPTSSLELSDRLSEAANF